MSLRYPVSTVILVGLLGAAAGLTAACTGAPVEGQGVVTITTPTPPAPAPPPALVAGSIMSEPAGFAVAAATNVSFNLSPTGGKPPYTVTWNFGDGSVPQVAPVGTRVFANPGNFTVLANVADADGKTAISNVFTVQVRDVAGRWRVTFGGAAVLPENIDIIQNGSELVASINETNAGFGNGPGAVSNPRAMSATLTFARNLPFPFAVTFVGALSPDLMTWTGTVVGYNACPCNFTAQRRDPPATPTVAPTSH